MSNAEDEKVINEIMRIHGLTREQAEKQLAQIKAFHQDAKGPPATVDPLTWKPKEDR